MNDRKKKPLLYKYCFVECKDMKNSVRNRHHTLQSGIIIKRMKFSYVEICKSEIVNLKIF